LLYVKAYPLFKFTTLNIKPLFQVVVGYSSLD